MVPDIEGDFMSYETIKDHFTSSFREPEYDGSYQTPLAEAVRDSFAVLSRYNIQWCQVHGDFKNVVKRGLFEPYPHWRELYACCRTILNGHVALNTQFLGDTTCARIMGEAMSLLRAKHGYNAPRWWLPVMNKLRSNGNGNV
jgi:hypothetical protein